MTISSRIVTLQEVRVVISFIIRRNRCGLPWRAEINSEQVMSWSLLVSKVFEVST